MDQHYNICVGIPLRLHAAVTAFLLSCLFALAESVAADVGFPGRDPGKAIALASSSVPNLENSVLAMTWDLRDGGIHPATVANKLTGQHFDLRGAELFRLSTQLADAGDGSFTVAIRLDPDKVVVLAGKDSRISAEIANTTFAVSWLRLQ